MPACTEATLVTPDHRGGPPWRRPALSPPASEQGSPAHGLPRALPSLGTRRLQGQRAGASPLPGRERMSCQHSPPHKSNHSPALQKTEVGPPGMLAAAHLPPGEQPRPLPECPPSPPPPALLAIHSRPHFQHGRATSDCICVQAKAVNSHPQLTKA